MQNPKFEIQSPKQKKALEQTLRVLRDSSLAGYVRNAILYGSCARGEEGFKSDIDLFVELDRTFEDAMKENRALRYEMLSLRAKATADEVYAVEPDIRFVIGDEWQKSAMTYYANVRKDGVSVWN